MEKKKKTSPVVDWKNQPEPSTYHFDMELAEKLWSLMKSVPPSFDPDRDDVFEDSDRDPGTLSAKNPLLIDKLSHLVVSQGRHDYVLRFPDDTSPLFRVRDPEWSVCSGSGLVRLLKPHPFDAPKQAKITVRANLIKLAQLQGWDTGVGGRTRDEHENLLVDIARRNVAEADPVVVMAWRRQVGNKKWAHGFLTEDSALEGWNDKKIKASRLGTCVHRHLECFYNDRLDLVRWTPEQMEAMKEPLRKFKMLLADPIWGPIFAKELAWRVEFNLWVPELDANGQGDILLRVRGGGPHDVVLADWKCLGGSLEEIQRDLKDYEAQLMWYAFKARNGVDPELRKKKVKRYLLVVLSPNPDIPSFIVHEFIYRQEVVDAMLEIHERELRKKLKEKLAVLESFSRSRRGEPEPSGEEDVRWIRQGEEDEPEEKRARFGRIPR